MPEYLAPGVYVDQVPSGAKPIAGVSTSSIAVVGVTERGPVNVPTLVTSFGAYTRTFGGFLDKRVFTENRNALPHAVQGAFDNGAGQIYINRIVGANAARAEADFFGTVAVDPSGTTLNEPAEKAATLLRIAEGSNLALGDRLLLSDGAGSEYVTASSDPVAIGVAITGRLRALFVAGTGVTLQQTPVVGIDLTSHIKGAMPAGGGLALDAAGVAALTADMVLRISQSNDPAATEYITITADAVAGFNEKALLFDHPKATARVEVATLSDDAVATIVQKDAAGSASLVPLAATAGIVAGTVITIGMAAAREIHTVRAVVSDLSIGATPTIAIHSAGVALIKQRPLLRVHARDVGQWGNRLRVRTRPSALCETMVTGAVAQNGSPVPVRTVVGLQIGSVVSIVRAGTEIARQRVTAVSRATREIELGGDVAVAMQADDAVVSQEFLIVIELLDANGMVVVDETFDHLALDPAHPRYAPHIVGAFDRATGEVDATGLSDLVRLSDLMRDDTGTDLAGANDSRLAAPFAGIARTLSGGNDDLATVTPATYIGSDAADVATRTGIHALRGIDDISIIAVPGQSSQIVQNAMITHCEQMRYRIAVLDGAVNARLSDIQAQRNRYDSTRGALYHPWLVIPDPFGQPNDRLSVPPSGHVCGAYALTDKQRGVHKAPANVAVRNILGLQTVLTKGEQQILNPRGINVIRDFSSLGRSVRIWGARTISSDPEWIYVPVRRLFLFVEKSIEHGINFAVFEPNAQPLWATIRSSITNFLTGVWRDGALAGAKPEDAFFVRVGLDTMTQSDLDNGHLIVLIGIAPVKPAEFMIFRISQKTADAAG